MKQSDEFNTALKQLKDSELAKELAINLLKASVEKWKEESIGKPFSEVERLHGAIIHTRTSIDLLEQDLTSFEPHPQSYT